MTRITRICADKDQGKEIAYEKYENRRKRLGRPAALGKETAHETHEAHEVAKKPFQRFQTFERVNCLHQRCPG